MDLALLAGFPVVIEQDVSWGDMDAFQHVSNLVYFRYFQDARIEYFRRLGWMPAPGRFGVGPIVQSTQARYRLAVSFPDRVAVGARVTGFAADRFTVEHKVVSTRHNAVTTEGQCVIVTFDYARGAKAPVPDDLRAAIDEIEKTT